VRSRVLEAVEREYAVIPAASVSWPDQHPDRNVADEEYSRVTNPGKYAIVGARATAWEQALVALGLATVRPTDVPEELAGVHDAVGFKLTPTAEGAAPLIIVHGGFEGGADNVVIVGAGTETPVKFGIEPDCGCDACDWGSESLIKAVDADFLGVVGGFVHAVGRKWDAHTTDGGWECAGKHPADLEQIFADARAGLPVRRGVRVQIGAPWWGDR
jgi:hypothetical protein